MEAQHGDPEQALDVVYSLGGKRPWDKVGYVYAAFSEGNGVKIGMTCQESLMKQIRALNIAIKEQYKTSQPRAFSPQSFLGLQGRLPQQQAL